MSKKIWGWDTVSLSNLPVHKRRPKKWVEISFNFLHGAWKHQLWNFHEVVGQNLWNFNFERYTCYGYKMYSDYEQEHLWFLRKTLVTCICIYLYPCCLFNKVRPRSSKKLNWQTNPQWMISKTTVIACASETLSQNVFLKTLLKALNVIHWKKNQVLRSLPAENVVNSSLSFEKLVEQSSNISKTTLQSEEKCDGPTNILQQERRSNLKLDFCQWRFWMLCTGPDRLFVWTVLPRHFASFANLCGLPPGSENHWLFSRGVVSSNPLSFIREDGCLQGLSSSLCAWRDRSSKNWKFTYFLLTTMSVEALVTFSNPP